jgi:hypothetical protein
MPQTLIAQVQVLPTPEQAVALEATLRRANAAAGVLSGVAWEKRAFGRRDLQKAAYHQVRESSGMSAQVVIRLIAKVADAYRKDKKVKRESEPLGAIAYDARILRWFAALNIRVRGRVAVMRPDAGEPGGLADEATHGAAATVLPAGDLASCLL